MADLPLHTLRCARKSPSRHFTGGTCCSKHQSRILAPGRPCSAPRGSRAVLLPPDSSTTDVVVGRLLLEALPWVGVFWPFVSFDSSFHHQPLTLHDIRVSPLNTPPPPNNRRRVASAGAAQALFRPIRGCAQCALTPAENVTSRRRDCITLSLSSACLSCCHILFLAPSAGDMTCLRNRSGRIG